ncbi:hypothetical protein Tco_0761816 [Tanacetum coccineum]
MILCGNTSVAPKCVRRVRDFILEAFASMGLEGFTLIYWILLNQFVSQLSIIAVPPKPRGLHFEILCRVHGFVPTVEMNLFAFIHHVDPTKVRIGEREVREGEVLLLELTHDRVVPLAGVNDQENANVQGVRDDNVNEGVKKRRKADGASGSNHPPKKLRADHGASGYVGASTGEKSLAAIQDLFEQSTLNVEVGVITVATVPFVTSSVTPTWTDSVSPSTAEANVAGPSQPASAEASTNTFFVSQDMDSEMLHQVYVPRWNVVNESALDDPDVCRNLVDQLAPPLLFSQLRSMDYEQLFAEFNLLLRESEAAEAIRLRSQVATIEATEAARASELDGLLERNAVLEGHVATFESSAIIKDTELASSHAQIAKMTPDLSNLQLSCDELTGRRWILSRGLRLLVMKCLQSLEYLAALGGAIGRAIDKDMQDGLAAGIDHGKARRGLVKVVAYNPTAEANYVAAVNALHAVDFPFLA